MLHNIRDGDVIVIATGGFDPIHSGHILYLAEAKKLGTKLIVGLNSDEWLTRKKGRPFMPFAEREIILSCLFMVDAVIGMKDDDGTAIDCIRCVRDVYPNNKIIFANGGDRTSLNIPEMDCGVENIEFFFGVGGNYKKNSSSWILKNWKE